jgi:hypothetical protein
MCRNAIYPVVLSERAGEQLESTAMFIDDLIDGMDINDFF